MKMHSSPWVIDSLPSLILKYGQVMALKAALSTQHAQTLSTQGPTECPQLIGWAQWQVFSSLNVKPQALLWSVFSQSPRGFLVVVIQSDETLNVIFLFLYFPLLLIHLIPPVSFFLPSFPPSASAVDSSPSPRCNLPVLVSNRVLERVTFCNNMKTLPVSRLKISSNEFN